MAVLGLGPETSASMEQAQRQGRQHRHSWNSSGFRVWGTGWPTGRQCGDMGMRQVATKLESGVPAVIVTVGLGFQLACSGIGVCGAAATVRNASICRAALSLHLTCRGLCVGLLGTGSPGSRVVPLQLQLGGSVPMSSSRGLLGAFVFEKHLLPSC